MVNKEDREERDDSDADDDYEYDRNNILNKPMEISGGDVSKVNHEGSLGLDIKQV